MSLLFVREICLEGKSEGKGSRSEEKNKQNCRRHHCTCFCFAVIVWLQCRITVRQGDKETGQGASDLF